MQSASDTSAVQLPEWFLPVDPYSDAAVVTDGADDQLESPDAVGDASGAFIFDDAVDGAGHAALARKIDSSAARLQPRSGCSLAPGLTGPGRR